METLSSTFRVGVVWFKTLGMKIDGKLTSHRQTLKGEAENCRDFGCRLICSAEARKGNRRPRVFSIVPKSGPYDFNPALLTSGGSKEMG